MVKTANGWLRNAFNLFFRDELVACFSAFGVPCKEERGGRIFPDSDDAADVNHALLKYLVKGGVQIITSRAAKKIILKNDKACGVVCAEQSFSADAVIVATGGASYPQTGSTGDGYKLARTVRHGVLTPTPALVPLLVKEKSLVAALQGVALKNVRLTIFACASKDIDISLIPVFDVGRGTGKRAKPPVMESRFGEMLFTHFGIGGPITLLSSLAAIRALRSGAVSAVLDIKPVLTHEQLSQRLQRDLNTSGKKSFKGILSGLLPRKMVAPVAGLSGIALDKRACDIDASERLKVVGILKSLRFTITGNLPLSRAIVTAGGISLKEINPSTMQSRLVEGLFFCGEVLDIDADTGGYNVQAAFSTGFVAGRAAADYIKKGN